MPVEFLSDEQVAAFGRFDGVPSRPELERFFFLDDADLGLISKRRRTHSQLGFALQVGTVRYLGTFLPDPLEVPWPVVDYLAAQLGIEDPSVVKRYTERIPTQHEHAREIRDLYGFRDFSDPDAVAALRQFATGRAWTHTEGQLALFTQSVAWLRRHRVLLPGASVLARMVASVREDATDRMHRALADAATGADPEMPGRLLDLLRVVDGQRFSELERLRRPPTRTSGKAMSAALDRVSDVLGVGARTAVSPTVPANRLVALARYGLTAKAPAIKLLAEPRRTATLLATAQALETAAVDDALDLFDVLMATRLISAARRSSAAERLAWMPRLEKASVTLARTARALLDALDEAGAADVGGQLDVAAAWAVVEQVAPSDQVTAAAALVDELVPDDYSGEAAMREALAARYGVVRPFLELLAEALPLQATAAGQDLLREVRRLPDLARRRTSVRPLTRADVAEDVVMPAWRRAVFTNPDLPADAVDRDAYVLCVLEQLHRALRRRDVFAAPSQRWADPRAQLLDGTAWQAVSGEILTGLGLTEPVDDHLADLSGALDTAWQTLAQRLAEAGPDASVRIVPTGAEGRVRLSVERLEAIGEPGTLTELRATVAAMLPRVDLPELLLEVQAWTRFLDEYVHVGELGTRMEDLPVSVAALLVAEACNVGLIPVTKPAVPALTRDRLSHVDQNYLRAETHSAANARLIEAQASVGVAQLWGGGLIASVDGLRFVVPVQTINAAPSPRYFGLRRGVTWLNAVNDQVAGIGAVVVPGTMRDSLHILDTLLNLDAGPKPDMVATDTASYSDIVFGLFRMLGYRFSPRIADLSDQRFWRADLPGAPAGDYGLVNGLARNKVNLDKIRSHWPDMLRVAGSLVTHRVRAYDLLRMLGRDGHPSTLGQAFAEYGRIAKTLHLLALIDPVDEGYRRTVHRQLTVQESRHRLARKIFHGQRGELRQSYREGQEDQLGALVISRSESPFGTCVLRSRALAAERYPPGVSGMSGTFAPMINRYRAERAVSARDESVSWVVVGVADYALHVEAVAFLAALRAMDRSANTERVYAGRVAMYLSYAADRGLDWSRPGLEDLARFLRWLVQEPLPPSRGRTPRAEPRFRSKKTANAVITTVCGFLRFGARHGWVPPEVVARLSEPKFLAFLPPGYSAGEDGQFRTVRVKAIKFAVADEGYEWLSAEQFEQLLPLTRNARDRFMVALMGCTGMRIGETLGLRREDMHLLSNSASLGCRVAGPHVHVRRRANANGALAKSRFPRSIPVTEELVQLYADYVHERDRVAEAAGCDMVFVNLFRQPLGRPLGYHNAKGMFDRLARRAGLVVRPHVLRHTAATRWVRSGVARDVVQTLLGHVSSSSMDPYVHATDQDKREAVERVAALREGRA